MAKYCMECGTLLEERYLENEGNIPYCPECRKFRFPLYNVGTSMIVREESTGKVLLIKQYGHPQYVLVAGYAGQGESIENTAAREVKEETGLDAVSVKFNRSRYFARTNTLMCNFTVWIKDASEICVNHEIDDYAWFTPDEAREAIKSDLAEAGLAEIFLNLYLDEAE